MAEMALCAVLYHLRYADLLLPVALCSKSLYNQLEMDHSAHLARPLASYQGLSVEFCDIPDKLERRGYLFHTTRYECVHIHPYQISWVIDQLLQSGRWSRGDKLCFLATRPNLARMWRMYISPNLFAVPTVKVPIPVAGDFQYLLGHPHPWLVLLAPCVIYGRQTGCSTYPVSLQQGLVNSQTTDRVSPLITDEELAAME
jgi:hypothetical protein